MNICTHISSFITGSCVYCLMVERYNANDGFYFVVCQIGISALGHNDDNKYTIVLGSIVNT